MIAAARFILSSSETPDGPSSFSSSALFFGFRRRLMAHVFRGFLRLGQGDFLHAIRGRRQEIVKIGHRALHENDRWIC
jgi:hypothetical protein